MNTRLEIAAHVAGPVWLYIEKFKQGSMTVAEFMDAAFEVADALIAKEAATRPPEILAGVDGADIRVRISSDEYNLIRRVKDPVRALAFLKSRGMVKAVDEPEVKP